MKIKDHLFVGFGDQKLVKKTTLNLLAYIIVGFANLLASFDSLLMILKKTLHFNSSLCLCFS